MGLFRHLWLVVSFNSSHSVAHEYIYDKDPVMSAIGNLDNIIEYDVMRRLSWKSSV